MRLIYTLSTESKFLKVFADFCVFLSILCKFSISQQLSRHHVFYKFFYYFKIVAFEIVTCGPIQTLAIGRCGGGSFMQLLCTGSIKTLRSRYWNFDNERRSQGLKSYI